MILNNTTHSTAIKILRLISRLTRGRVFRISILAAFLLVSAMSRSYGAGKTWVGAAGGGSWSTTTNWNPATALTSTDDIVINAGTSVMSFTGSTVTINSLTINGTTGSATWTSPMTITVNATTTFNVNIPMGSVAFLFNGAASIAATKTITMASSSNNISLGASGSLAINGAILMTAGSVTNTTNSKITIPSGGSYTYNSGANSGQLPNMTVAAGGIVTVAPGTGTPILVNMSMAGKLIIGGTGNINSTSGSDVSYTGTSAILEYQCTTARNVLTREWPTSGVSAPANVTINYSGTIMTLTSTRSITGSLTLTSGVFTLSGSSTVLNFSGTGATAPIVAGSGTMTCASSPNSPSINFTPTSSANWVIPASIFTSAPTLTNMTSAMNPSLTTGSLTLNNQAITVSSTFTLSNGLVILGTGDLQVATMSASSPGATKMFVTSSTSGYLKHSFSTSSFQSFTYPIGENVGTAEYNGFSFSLNSNNTTRVIGFRVTDACAPNIGTSTYYLSRYYSSTIVPSTGTYNYTVTLPYDAATSAATTCGTPTPGDAVGGTIATVNSKIGVMGYSGSGTTWNGYQGTISSGLVLSSADQASSPLGFDITGRQVTNDDCAGAVTLTVNSGATCTSTTTGNSLGATQSQTSCSGAADDDVWFKFVATATSHTITVTPVTMSDVVFQVFSGTCGGTLTSLLCRDITSGTTAETGSVGSLTIGSTYFVRVHSYGSSSGQGSFTVCVLSPPANDEYCSGSTVTAVTLTPGTTCVTTAGDAALASQTNSYGSCDFSFTSPLADVWYRFQATNTAHTVVVTGNSTYDPIVTAYSATGSTCPATLTAISGACVDATGAAGTESLSLSGLTIGNWYYVRVYHGSSTVPSNTTFTICVRKPLDNDEPCNGSTVTAVTLTPGATCTGTAGDAALASQTYSYGSCDFSSTSPLADVWFRFQATNTHHYVSATGNGTYDPIITAYSATGSTCPATLTAISGACADATGAAGTETIMLTTTVGNWYYVRVYHGSSTVPSNTTFSICVFNPPANDECAGATSLGTLATLGCTNATVNTNNATASGNTVCASGTADDDLWYTFTVPAGYSKVYFSTTNVSGSTDRVFQFYSGSCGSLTQVLCSDPELGTLTVTGGATYYMRVYTWSSGVTTNVTVCLNLPPANDDVCGAITLTVNPGNVCTTTTTGDVNNASQTFSGSSCAGTADDDVWFKFTATATSHNIRVVGSAFFSPVVQAYFAAACGSVVAGSNIQTCSYSSTDAATINMQLTSLTIGNIYYVRVYDYWSGEPTTTTFTVCVQSPPANDECAGAVDLGTITSTCSGTAGDASLASQTFTYGSCDFYGANPARDVWYKFTTNAGGTSANIKVVGSSSYDAVVQAYSGACGSLTAISGGCIDNYGTGATETLHLTGLTASTTYFVRVYHTSFSSTPPSTTTFTICAVIPPANDDCPGTTLTLGAGAISGTTVNASQTTDDYYFTGYDDDDVWYSFVASGTSHQVIVNGTGLDAVVDFRSTTCPGFSRVTHDFTSTGSSEIINITGLTSGATYRFRVFSWSSLQGSFTVAANNTGYTPSGNDNVANAITAGTGTTNGNAYLNYGLEIGEPEGSNWAFDPDINTVSLGNTAWFVFTPSSSGNYSISATTGGNQFLLGIYSASSAAALLSGSYAEIASTPHSSSASLACLSLTAGTNYYIQFNGNVGAGGTPSVTITDNTLGTPSFTAGSSTHCLGETDTYTATASGASSISYSIVSGGATINSSSGFVNNITGNFTVRCTAGNGCATSTADFAVTITTYDITASAGANGSITDPGITAVMCGDNKSYTITADPNFHIDDVLVDFVSQGPITSYTFTGVNAAHTISAIFAPDIFLTNTHADVTCNGGNDGSIDLSVTGGATPYTYQWSNSETTEDVTGLTAGTYAVTVTDFNSNSVSTSVTITQLSALSVSCSGSHVSCNGGSNGTASVTASGGTVPYSYLWSNSSTDASINGLLPGTYSVTVTDGCSATVTCSFIVIDPPLLTASCGGTDISCNGGSNGTASVTVSGGIPGYSYSWNTGGTTAAISSLGTGNYSVTVTDSKGCTAICNFTVSEPSALSVSCSGTNGCNGGNNGTASVMANGGTPGYSYLWSNTATTAAISSLSADTYTVTVTDSKGCIGVCSYIVVEPAALSATAGDDSPICAYNDALNLTSSISGGTPGYSYSWSGPSGYSSTDANPTIASTTPANDGTYFVTVTDANGCSIIASTTATVNLCITTLNLTLFIEGHYIGSGQMQPTLLNEGVFGATGAETDTITVELRDTLTPANVVESVTAVLMTDGSATATFSGTITGGTYWICVKHRNAIQTWSNSTIFFNAINSYNFTTSSSQAFGGMRQIEPGVWGFYNGDINQDENTDLLDFPDMDYGINNGLFGYYTSDLNGDGNVDLLDFPILDTNINSGIFSIHP